MSRAWNVLICALALGLAEAAQAAGSVQFDISAQPLGDSLADVAKRAGLNLVFDPRLTAGLVAPPLHGRMTVDEALKRLLAASALSFNTTVDGAVLIRRRLAASSATLDAQPNIPEILVIGRRALNVDLVRSEDDIQPYQIMGHQTIEESGAQSLDAVFKSRLPSNSQALLSTQVPVFSNGSTRSQINLKGLGTGQTLILVDGHRLPSFPEFAQFGQSDINGIPLNAIDRVETLPSTAGGIYGPGASGGVVNIVLKHEASGIDITTSRGITARGDDPNWRIQAHAGFTAGGGDTKADLFYEHSEDAGLQVGQRPYVEAAATARFQNEVAAMPSGGIAGFAFFNQFPAPYSKSINFLGQSPLFFSTQFGGGPIGSNYTFIPVADIGTPQEAAILKANAGKLDFSLPDTGEGLQESLLTRTRRDGGVLTLRQRVSDRVDIFLDAMASREKGTAVGGLEFQAITGATSGVADTPIVGGEVSFPPIANTGIYSTTDTQLQATAGLVATLSYGWQLEADLTAGIVNSRSRFPQLQGASDAADPFAGVAALQAYEASLQPYPYIRQHASDRLLDGNLRLAGPVFRFPAGPVSLTVLGEMRSDRTHGIAYDSTTAIDFSDPSIQVGSATGTFLKNSPGQKLSDGSLYAELRAPILANDSSLSVLRGLEIQAAVRGDHYHLTVPRNPVAIETRVFPPDDDDDDDSFGVASTRTDIVHQADNLFAFTLGAKFEPIAGLTLRGSVATGAQPPDTSYLTATTSINIGFVEGNDSKRGDEQITAPLDTAGSGNLKPSHYRSLLIGAILTPHFVRSLRLSIDYSHISSTREVFAFPSAAGAEYFNQPGFFLDNEATLPGRIVRAPLTDADRAKGYTAGAITLIDGSPANSASSHLDSIDFNLRYGLSTAIGQFAVSGQFTWILDFRRKTAPYEPSYSALGYVDGPSPWKGNVEVDWTRGAVTAGANLQLFGPYRGASSPEVIAGVPDGLSQSDAINFLLQQGRPTVPPQAYLDAFVGFRVKVSPDRPALQLRLSCQNLLDKDPPLFTPILTAPYVSNFGLGYSYYGDPRGRRFAIDVTASF